MRCAIISLLHDSQHVAILLCHSQEKLNQVGDLTLEVTVELRTFHIKVGVCAIPTHEKPPVVVSWHECIPDLRASRLVDGPLHMHIPGKRRV
eukprot:CAMPEP_0170587208 /NCGR_PEP_ID=MMETSP0224-20130122/10163_1 /TAXON_ID=285029 /ORGANISM="Togula jolla, Strain CCCM 725" /LENGTH=91 /DNA_ID=CAMNT_0010910821 /DNA_START=535 /DNA_END=810 /DNA_ORIENTATION=-